MPIGAQIVRLVVLGGEGNQAQRLVAVIVDQGAVVIGADFGLREAALEQRHQARIDRDLQLAGLAHGALHIGQDVGEHEFVAQALFADQQHASCRRAASPFHSGALIM